MFKINVLIARFHCKYLIKPQSLLYLSLSTETEYSRSLNDKIVCWFFFSFETVGYLYLLPGKYKKNRNCRLLLFYMELPFEHVES